MGCALCRCRGQLPRQILSTTTAANETGALLGLLREPVRATHSRRQRRLRSSGHIRNLWSHRCGAPVSWMLASFALIGGVATASRSGTFVSSSVVLYLLLVLFYPFMPTRNCCSLAPLVIRQFSTERGCARRRHERPGEGPQVLVLFAVYVPIAALVVTTLDGHVGTTVTQCLDGSTVDGPANTRRVIWVFGRLSTGIRVNTDTHAVLASGYDPMYYLPPDARAFGHGCIIRRPYLSPPRSPSIRWGGQ